ncbi:MAG TPA: STAS domain-containing protein [Thermoleophilia bacterium]
MNLGISKDLIGHVLVVHVSGDLDVYTAPQLKEALADTLAADGAALVLDLSKVHFIDSTALGVLASSLQQSKSHEGDLRLVIDDPYLLKIFHITGFDDVFAVYPKVADALSAR